MVTSIRTDLNPFTDAERAPPTYPPPVPGSPEPVPIRQDAPAALLYSLIQSAKLCKVEPRAYLREATLRAVRNPGTVTLARDLKSPES